MNWVTWHRTQVVYTLIDHRSALLCLSQLLSVQFRVGSDVTANSQELCMRVGKGNLKGESCGHV